MTNLTKKQHTFPVASLNRFRDSNGLVHTHIKKAQRTQNLKPNNNLFTVNRVWDQHAEAGYGKNIEDRFQNIAEDLIKRSRRLTTSENKAVADFYCLWSIRTDIEYYDQNTTNKIKGIKGKKLSQEEKNNLELRHAFYVEEDGTVPWRFIRGGAMLRAIDMFSPKLANTLPWVLFNSDKFEVLVADHPGDSFVIPLTPYNYLSLANSTTSIEQINWDALCRSRIYYFAKNLGHVIA